MEQLKNVTQINTDHIPWKIVAMNAQGLVTKKSKVGIEQMRELVKDEKILLMNFTETWYKETIKENADIEGYNIFRCDRNAKIIKGGVAIYLQEKVEAEQICELRYKDCEMVAINIPELNTINIVVYRPPKTKKIVFDKILDEIEKIYKNTKKPEPTIILSGDFNFSFVEWNRMPSGGCTWKYKTKKANVSNDKRLQFLKLMKICDEQCMLQIIEEETRDKNTLDLIYTNEIGLVTDIDVNKSAISDHNKIEVSTNYKIKEEKIQQKNSGKSDTMTSLNFHAKGKNKINWDMIKKGIKDMDWKKICEDGNAIEIIELLLKMLTKLSMEVVPKKKNEGKERGISKEVKKLLNRIKMLKREKHKAHSKKKKKIIENKILETEKELIKTKQKKKHEIEKQAIERMNVNPKIFYSIINNQKNRKNKVGPFKENGEIIDEGEEICEKLVLEFLSQFSKISSKINGNPFQNEETEDLNDIEITVEDIKEAIDDMDENSAAGPDGIPAILLKKIRDEIALPLAMILRKSIDEGKIPDIFKLAYVTPIHKGGSRQKPEQYRPVSLTSHVMKVFERVIKKKIIKYLIENQKFNDGQHGFVPGRSTQTQLLCHYNDIYEALCEGKRLDTVFLDFAKAFDKVDHNILLEKVKKHGIGGKLGRWIMEFLRGRKFRVVANGCISREEDVISGVPQGTVLAAILFVIMISDIDENVKSCLVRSFADDTRVNKKIEGDLDKELMQKDLEAIYEWAEKNKMKFNEGKFEQMSHGTLNGVTIDPYKNSDGEEIEIKETVKDLGVMATNDLKFKEHIGRITTQSKVTMGMLLRTFSTREKGPMIKMFNSYIKSKLEYCSTVWSPVEQKGINEIENIQRIFTKKIEGMEELDYHQRLKELKMYSMERRRERYMIIYGWQQLEGKK